MDLYRAFDTAMKSDSEELKNTAMEAGKSAYHHILYAGVESGDGKKIKGSYLTGIMKQNLLNPSIRSHRKICCMNSQKAFVLKNRSVF